MDRITDLLNPPVMTSWFPETLLNRFISVETYRAGAKPDRQTDGEAKPRLRRSIPVYSPFTQTPFCAIKLRELQVL